MMLLTKVQVTDVWECKWEAKKSYGEFEVAKFKFSPPPIDDTTHVRGHGECQDFDRHILPARGRANKISLCVFLSQICRHDGSEPAKRASMHCCHASFIHKYIQHIPKTHIFSRRCLKGVSGLWLSAPRTTQTLLTSTKNQDNRLNFVERSPQQS